MVIPIPVLPGMATPSYTVPSLGDYDTIFANHVRFDDDGYVTNIKAWMTSTTAPDALAGYPGSTGRCALLTLKEHQIGDRYELGAELVAQTPQQGIVSGINTFTFSEKVKVSKNKEYLIAMMGDKCNLGWYADTTTNTAYNLYNMDMTYLYISGDENFDYGICGDGTYIYTNNGGLAAYTFDGTTLTQAGIELAALPTSIWCDGTYIYVADSGTLSAYTFDGTAFHLIANQYDGGGDSYMYVYGDGTYIYVASNDIGGNSILYAYTFDGVNFNLLDSDGPGNWYQSLYADKNHYIYIGTNSDMRAFTFDGVTLTLVDSIVDGDHQYTMYGDGTYIYSAVPGANKIYAYSFDGVTLSNIGTANGKAWAMHGDGHYIYITAQMDDIYAYTFDGTNFTNEYSLDYNYLANMIYSDGKYVYTTIFGGPFNYMLIYTVQAHGVPTASEFPVEVTGQMMPYDDFFNSQMLPGYFALDYTFEPGVAWLTLPATLYLRGRR